jgi:prepilin peptidase CpaA
MRNLSLFDPLMFWPTAILVATATLTDLRSRRIPNWLTLPFLIFGMATSGFEKGWSGLECSFLGVLAGSITMGFFCYLGGMGMGDLKLCATVGAWVGLNQMLLVLVMTGLAGGLIAVCWALAGGVLGQTLRGTAGLVAGFARRGLRPHETLVLDNALARRMPYAPAIAIGTIFSFLGRH